ncbi:hypothetical protein GCM10019059_43300 [Camelimonas fluminis]|nr:hypothetical protein GCM10019059_43300 [Camelimonas fluminis]
MLRSACAFNEVVPRGDVWLFDPSDLATKVVKEVVSAVGLKPNFSIKAGNVANAGAYIDTDKLSRTIVYSETWLRENIEGSKDSYWKAIALVSHECAHHFNSDTLEILKPGSLRNFGATPGDNQKKELAADEFAGFVIGRMGGSVQNAQSLFLTLSEEGSSSHPGRAARVEAATIGWGRGRPHGHPSPVHPQDAGSCKSGAVGPEFVAGGQQCRQFQICEPEQARVVGCKENGKWVFQR